MRAKNNSVGNFSGILIDGNVTDAGCALRATNAKGIISKRIISTLIFSACFLTATANSSLAAQPAAADEREAFVGENGDMFMEEVTDPKNKPVKKPTIPIDLSRVGVSVDPHGNIVPIKDSADDSWAGTGVKPFMNQIQNTFEALPFNGFAGPSPYGYGVPGRNMAGYVDPRLNYRTLGYPNYGYPGYGYGYPGYQPGININFGGGRGGISIGGPGYNNGYYGNGFNNGYGNGFGLNIGGYGGYNGGYNGGYTPWNTFNSFAGGGNPYYGNTGYGNAGYGRPYNPGYSPYTGAYIGPNGGYNPYTVGYNPYGYPATGAPLATFNIGKFQGAIGSSGPGIYPNAANSVFFPSTTNYSGTSMWRAFNLAF